MAPVTRSTTTPITPAPPNTTLPITHGLNCEFTASRAVCDHCGTTGAVGALRAYTHAPGVVLRCSTCVQIVIRFAVTPAGIYLDLRGASCMRIG